MHGLCVMCCRNNCGICSHCFGVFLLVIGLGKNTEVSGTYLAVNSSSGQSEEVNAM